MRRNNCDLRTDAIVTNVDELLRYTDGGIGRPDCAVGRTERLHLYVVTISVKT